MLRFPTRSDPKREKKTTNMRKKRPTSALEAAEKEKKVPKSDKCANMGPIYVGWALILDIRPFP